ncbi:MULTISPECIES: hypothetical protein [unclassified Fibrobacter]|uniref:hypothetical protein n=1 Tax=unclassified Fibrobacter TaxID=2634177 RepID=UPI000D6CFD8D|nr:MULTISPECIES: hypothetical protein [unclassified Fibrobacter]PWJ68512.1 hypothetical protein BGX12_10738 [Fibrobacter sp. UWR4]PZW72096.1 hypothetical protein C8E88_100868 [Fibrobacter sp. UWR1]
MCSSLYKVGGHVFSVIFEDEALSAELLPLMGNYMPFQVASAGNSENIFDLKVVADTAGSVGGLSLLDYEIDIRQEEEGQSIDCGHTVDGCSVFIFKFGDKLSGMLICSEDYRRAELRLAPTFRKAGLDNALMVLYALATARMNTVLFHAAVVSKDGKGYMFLGKSGTGKSTHARLWLKNIAETELVNDDNPVVRIRTDGAWVYGSPWSGKTPCYKNLTMPLGGVVLLSQAPYNKIVRLRGLQAYAAIVPSISGKRWDTSIADGLHETENRMAQIVPSYYLECLPDAAAAELCCKTIKV